MAKKKVETTNSVALFDEEPPVKKALVKEAVKKTKKKDVVDNNSTDNSSSVVNTRHGRKSKSEKETKTSRGRKQQSTPDVDEKPRRSSKATDKGASRVDADKKLNKRVTKSDKDNSDKGTARRAKKETGTSRNTTDSSSKQRKSVDRPVSNNEEKVGEKPGGTVETDDVFKEAKKHKHIFTRGPEIWPPKPITGKPRPVKDGELLAIIVDGEYLEVSPWSVKNGIYRQGMDGNFLVKYLHYEPVATKYDAANAALNELINKKEEK